MQQLSIRNFYIFSVCSSSFPAVAAQVEEEHVTPPDITELKEAKSEGEFNPEDLINEFREESQKEAALSYF